MDEIFIDLTWLLGSSRETLPLPNNVEVLRYFLRTVTGWLSAVDDVFSELKRQHSLVCNALQRQRWGVFDWPPDMELARLPLPSAPVFPPEIRPYVPILAEPVRTRIASRLAQLYKKHDELANLLLGKQPREWLSPFGQHKIERTILGNGLINALQEMFDLRNEINDTAYELLAPIRQLRLTLLEVVEGVAHPESPHQDARLAGLAEFARTRLKAKQRRVIDLLIEHGGSLSLASLATDEGIGWLPPYDDSFSSLQSRLNEKLDAAGLPYRIARHDGEVRIDVKTT